MKQDKARNKSTFLQFLFTFFSISSCCQFEDYENSLLPKSNQYIVDDNCIADLSQPSIKLSIGFWSFNIPLIDQIRCNSIFQAYQETEIEDGQLLFIIKNSQNDETFSIGYKSYNYPTLEVFHIIKIYNQGQAEKSIILKFPALNYAGRWILHLFSFQQDQDNNNLFIIEANDNDQQQISINNYFGFKFHLGGKGYISDLNLNIFQGRLSKIICSSDKEFLQLIEECIIPQQFQEKQITRIVTGQRYLNGNTLESYYFDHSGKGYYISGWIKYIPDRQQIAYYTLLRLSGYQFYKNKQMIGDELFLLEAVLNLYQKHESKIQIFSDAYGMPEVQTFEEQYSRMFDSVSQQQNEIYQAKKILQFIDNELLYEGLTQWHFLQYEYLQNIEKNNMHLIITFFNELNTIEEYLGDQIFQGSFINSRFYLIFGGDNFNFNYLKGEVSDLQIVYSYETSQINLMPQICDITCLTCDGPLKNNCLSCNEEQNRYYLSGLKICKCNDGYIETEQDGYCIQPLELYPFLIIEDFIKKEVKNCEIGYFRLPKSDNSIECKPCPQIINNNQISCADCILQSKTWYLKPVCKMDIIKLIDDINAPYFLKQRNENDYDLYLIGNDGELKLYPYAQDFCDSSSANGDCYEFLQQHLGKNAILQCKDGYSQLDWNRDCEFGVQNCLIRGNLISCDECVDGYYSVKLQQFRNYGYCEPCPSICLTCNYNIDENILQCTSCINTYGLSQGQCVDCGINCQICNEEYNLLQDTYYLRCIKCIDDSKYYIGLEGVECKLNIIPNCLYSFETLSYDYEVNSLDINFKIQQDRDNVIELCGACEIGYMYIFEQSQCVEIDNSECDFGIGSLNLQSNQFELKECLISSDKISTISQIQFAKDCRLYIQNCISCLQTDFANQYICFECQSGFYASKQTGLCVLCSEDLFCDVCVQQDKILKDHWKNNVRAFYRRYIEIIGGHQFIKNAQTQNYNSYEIKCQICKQGYKLFNNICIPYCQQDCAECIFYEEKYHCIKCHPIKQNFYPLSLENNQCIECPENCKLCRPRTQQEIITINPLFDSEIFKKYSHHCLQPIDDNTQRNFYDDDLGLFFQCSEENHINCQKQIVIELRYYQFQEELNQDLENIEDPRLKELFILQNISSDQLSSENSFPQIQNNRFYQLANKLGITSIIIKIIFQSEEQLLVQGTIKQELSKNVFTLINVELDFIFLEDTIFSLDQGIKFINFTKIQLLNIWTRGFGERLIFKSIFEQEIIVKQFRYKQPWFFSKWGSFIIYNAKSIIFDSFSFDESQGLNKSLIFVESSTPNFTANITNFEIQNNDFDFFTLFTFNTSNNAILYFQNFSFVNFTFTSSNFLQAAQEIKQVSLIDFRFRNLTFNSSVDFFNFIFLEQVYFQGITIIDSQFVNSSFMNIYKQAQLQEIQITRCQLLENSILFHNLVGNTSILNITFQNFIFEDISYDASTKFIHFQKGQSTVQQLEIYQISIKNNYLINFLINYNRYQDEYSLIVVQLEQVIINKYYIERGPGFTEFYFNGVSDLTLIDGVITQTKFSFKGLNQNVNCFLQKIGNQIFPQSIFLYKIQNLLFEKLSIIKIQVIDFPIIFYYSILLDDNEEIKNITFNEIIIQESLLLQTKSQLVLGLISIECLQKSQIIISNSQFNRNIFHQYDSSSLDNAAGLLTILGNLQNVHISDSIFSKNFVTNSTSSIFNIKVEVLSFENCKFFNNSIFIYEVMHPNLFWGYENFDNVTYEQFEEIFKIKSIAGNGLLKIEQLAIINSIFDGAQGTNGGCFKIDISTAVTIDIQNCNFSSISNLFVDDTENGAIFYITAQSFLQLKLIINNIKVNKIYCKNYGGFLWLASQISEINIKMDNAYFTETYAQIGSIIFSSIHRQGQSIISIKNLSFINSQQGYLQYLNKFTSHSNQDIQTLANNRTLIYLQNVDRLNIQALEIQNLQFESLIYGSNLTNLDMNNVRISNSSSVSTIISIIPIQNLNSTFYISNLNFKNIYIGFSIPNQDCIDLISAIQKMAFQCIAQSKEAPKQLNHIQEQNTLNYAKCLINFIIEELEFTQTGLIKIEGLTQFSRIKLTDCNFKYINCSICRDGLIKLIMNSNTIQQNQKLRQINIHNSSCGDLGCIIINQSQIQQNSLFNDIQQASQSYDIILQNYKCVNNLAQFGCCLFASQINILVSNSIMTQNNASEIGGAIYFEGNYQLILQQSTIQNNTAKIGGGIYLKQQLPGQYRQLDNHIKNNIAFHYGLNIASNPISLTLQIGGKLLQTMILKENQDEIIEMVNVIKYKTLNGQFSDFLMIPTGQSITSYSFFDWKNKIYINSNLTLRIIALGKDFEVIQDLSNTNCQINSRQILDDNQNDEFTNNYTSLTQIQYDQITQSYNLDTMVVYFDNNVTTSKYLQLEFTCNSIQIPIYQIDYPYQILKTHSNYKLRANFKTYQCQFGEMKNSTNFACEKCDSALGMFSLQLDQHKCNIINEINTISVLDNKLNLRAKYWRPYFDTTDISYCLNLPENCLGGWIEGDNSCYLGHIGALCEQCDLYDIKGEGRFSVSDQFSCSTCQNQVRNTIFIFATILFTLIFLFVSVQGNLKNIEDNHRFKPIQRATLSTNIINAQSSILMKMLTNYLQIVVTITTFQLQFPSVLQSTMNAVGNPIQTATYSLDCFLTNMFPFDVIYGRMIWQIIMPFLYSNLFLILFLLSFKLKLTNFNSSVITTTLIYMFIYFQPNLMGGFVSLISYRNISGFKWIQTNVSQRYDTSNHIQWILKFCLPSMLIFSLIIPLYLYYGLFKNRDKLEKRSSRLNWGYLYNEYKIDAYYWELIKIIQKTLIILSLNYYQDNVVIKGILVLFITYLYQELNNNYQPYALHGLNKLDYYSANICMITICLAIGAYISQTTNILELKYPFFIIMVVLNINFLKLILGKIIEEYMKAFEKILDKIRDKIRLLFPNLKIAYLQRILKNRGKQRKIILDRFQRIRTILIPLSRSIIETRRMKVESLKFNQQTRLISSKDLQMAKMTEIDLNASLIFNAEIQKEQEKN